MLLVDVSRPLQIANDETCEIIENYGYKLNTHFAVAPDVDTPPSEINGKEHTIVILEKAIALASSLVVAVMALTI